MSAFKLDEACQLKKAAQEILSTAHTHNTFALSKADVQSLAMSPSGYCYVPFPFDVAWIDPRLQHETGESSIELTFRATGLDALGERDPEFADKITSWVIKHRRLAYERALCHTVIEQLDALCSNATQVRYLWPTVTLLVNKLGAQLDSLANKIRDFKQPRIVPNIPVGLRGALREAAAILTMNALVEDEGSWGGEVQIDCGRYFNFEAHGMDFGGY